MQNNKINIVYLWVMYKYNIELPYIHNNPHKHNIVCVSKFDANIDCMHSNCIRITGGYLGFKIPSNINLTILITAYIIKLYS